MILIAARPFDHAPSLEKLSAQTPPDVWAETRNPIVLPSEPRNLAERHTQTRSAALNAGRTGVWVRDDVHGHYQPSRARYLLTDRPRPTPWQQQALAYLRDHVNPGIPRAYYQAVLGHDLHISTWATLHAQHFHASLYDPFTGELGWLENIGRVSRGKVTTAFRDFEVDQLQAESSLYGDYKYQEVGTDNTAESNAQTALIVTSGIARVAGTQTEAAADIYRTVATVVADASETWQEHGLFDAASGPTLLDRSLISPTVAVVALDSVAFTYSLTKNAEA